jgi:O-acetyl-ADP-ribose deacetylase (regulator of RNase III)
MAMTEHQGDLFTSNTDAIGHGVNCQGLMGAGIARKFRELWPDMYNEYKKLCQEGLLRPGQIYPYRTYASGVVINIATQEYPGPDANYVWLERGVNNALAFCEERGLTSLALPRLGCGIGGLDWNLVRDSLERAAENYSKVDLEVWSL